MFVDGRRAHVRHRRAPVVANLAVGVSLGLPLFLYMREDAGASRIWTDLSRSHAILTPPVVILIACRLPPSRSLKA